MRGLLVSSPACENLESSQFILTNEKENKPENGQIFLDTQEQGLTTYQGRNPKADPTSEISIRVENLNSNWGIARGSAWRSLRDKNHGETQSLMVGDDTLVWFYLLEFCQVLTVNIRKNKDCISGCCCYVTSVVSDSVRPHSRQPARLPRPWDSPGRNTGVGCHFLLQCMKVKSES